MQSEVTRSSTAQPSKQDKASTLLWKLCLGSIGLHTLCMGVAHFFVPYDSLPATAVGDWVRAYTLMSLPALSGASCASIFLIFLLIKAFERLSTQHLPKGSESAVLLSNLPSVLEACAVFVSLLALVLSLRFVWMVL